MKTLVYPYFFRFAKTSLSIENDFGYGIGTGDTDPADPALADWRLPLGVMVRFLFFSNLYVQFYTAPMDDSFWFFNDILHVKIKLTIILKNS